MASTAAAEPYRLRGEAFTAAHSPVGLLILNGEDRSRPWLDAEALVWTGSGDESSADALVVSVRLRDLAGRGEVRVGRLVLATGAVRPLHLDGVVVRARAPYHNTIELFGGTPVGTGLADRPFDWLVGSRLAHTRHGWGTMGVSFYHQHDGGDLFDEEVGVDFATVPVAWLDVATLLAYDLVSPGISDARVSVAARRGALRLELFGGRRSPSRILPATSLFSVLGDAPSDEVGAGFRWRAAPRLDLHGSAAARSVGGAAGADLSLWAVLRLDDRGAGALSATARRQDGPSSSWTGARLALRWPLAEAFAAATELELVIPDDSNGRGRVWPWGLVAITWRANKWEAAAAIEAKSSPESAGELNALFRVARLWEASP